MSRKGLFSQLFSTVVRDEREIYSFGGGSARRRGRGSRRLVQA